MKKNIILIERFIRILFLREKLLSRGKILCEFCYLGGKYYYRKNYHRGKKDYCKEKYLCKDKFYRGKKHYYNEKYYRGL